MPYLILIALFLFSPFFTTPTYSQDTLQLKEYYCPAFDSPSLKDCLQQVKDIGVPLIKITKPITCNSRQDCSFEIKDFNRSFEISSAAAEDRFIRKNDFGYTLFNIQNSSGFRLKNLSFEDDGTVPCPAGTTCPPLITLKNSSQILIDKLTFTKTHGPSLAINDSKDITVSNSEFNSSFKTGLEITSQSQSQGLNITGNTFADNFGSALTFQAQNTDISQALISNNTFNHNHSGGSYSNCIYPCIGAQVKISGPSSNIRMSGNIVSGGVNGLFDILGLYSSGIEIGGSNIQSTLLFCNQVSGNRGSGIVQSGPFSNISQIRVSENKIWGNGLNLNIPTVTADENNCYTQECKLSCAK